MKKIIIIVVSLILVFSACKLAPPNTIVVPVFDGEGTLYLSLSSDYRAAIINNPDLDISSYFISGVHENTVDTFTDVVVNKPDTSAVIPGLPAGNWTVTVEGYDGADAAGTMIASGSFGPITVSDNDVTSQSITVVPITGVLTAGFLDIDLSWSGVTSPALSASLVGPASYDDVSDPTNLSIGAIVSDTSTLTGTDIQAGYYILTLTLTGTGFSKTVQTVVRVVHTLTTTGSVNFDDPGGLSINILEDLKDPFTVTLSGVPVSESLSLAASDTMTVSATPTGSGETYLWYLNGTATTEGVTGNSIVIDSKNYPFGGGDFPEGFYTLTAIVTLADGETMSSEDVTFTVDP